MVLVGFKPDLDDRTSFKLRDIVRRYLAASILVAGVPIVRFWFNTNWFTITQALKNWGQIKMAPLSLSGGPPHHLACLPSVPEYIFSDWHTFLPLWFVAYNYSRHRSSLCVVSESAVRIVWLPISSLLRNGTIALKPRPCSPHILVTGLQH